VGDFEQIGGETPDWEEFTGGKTAYDDSEYFVDVEEAAGDTGEFTDPSGDSLYGDKLTDETDVLDGDNSVGEAEVDMAAEDELGISEFLEDEYFLEVVVTSRILHPAVMAVQ